MQRARLAFMAIVVLGLGGLAFWTVSARPRDAAVAVEPLFVRFVVAPGADPSVLPLALNDARLIEIDRNGALLVHDAGRVRRQQKPRAFQEVDGRRLDVPIRFEISASGDPHLAVGPYDRTRALVIE